MRRIGIYSGTFDPIHPGHVAFATEALQVCGLDEVLFLPEQRPRGKSKVTALAHRLALIERTLSDHSNLRALQLASAQFTVEHTLPELRRILGDGQLTLLVGSDIARTFLHRWEGLGTLLAEVSLAIGLRNGDTQADMAAIMDRLADTYNLHVHYTLMAAPEKGMTSSQIRNGIADLSRLHPGALDYIREYRLYTERIAPTN